MKRSVILFTAIILSLFLNASCREGVPAASSGAKALRTPQTQSGKPKIIAFGDSLTAGFGLPEAESYPYLLQKRLEAEGFAYEVINAGVSGDTTLGGLERADWVLGHENAEILILELGANDIMRGVPPAKIKENLRKILQKAKEKNLKVLFCGMLTPPGSANAGEIMNVFPDLADEFKVEFLPFLLEGVALKKELNQPDGIHPNAEGEKIMTENVYKALKPLLAKP